MTLTEKFEALPKNKVVSERGDMVKELAELTKKTENTVYRWLRGDLTPGALEQEVVAKHYGVSVEELFPKSQAHEVD